MPDPQGRLPDPPSPAGRERPWVQLKTFTSKPNVFRSMVGDVSADARQGDVVTAYDKQGSFIGYGFWNAGAPIALRILKHTPGRPDDAWFEQALRRAVALRRDLLKLDADTDAYRAVNGDADFLSGLIVDRLGDVLSIEVSSVGVMRRLPRWLPVLHDALGTKREIVQVDPHVARIEGIMPTDVPKSAVRFVKIKESGMVQEVDFADGHKTGFFCDQRDNRRKFGALAKGLKVLDLCCYTGGFSIAAKLAGAAEVTGVDLDEKAVEMAKRNANLNNVRVDFVHADAFSWIRQMQKNGKTWDLVLCDPPKFVDSRDPDLEADGLKKYNDLNVLAMQLVSPGGLFVTCSCSGLVSAEAFEELVTKAAHRYQKRLQIFDRTGPGGDHPTASNHPEGRYLKVLWSRIA
ncbi:MAG: class I SAM-dependent rRNA methyltransferase [Opitutales bacterium]|jgi:23S rRNA (cytosine1962-C5)-methyltransferase